MLLTLIITLSGFCNTRSNPFTLHNTLLYSVSNLSLHINYIITFWTGRILLT